MCKQLQRKLGLSSCFRDSNVMKKKGEATKAVKYAGDVKERLMPCNDTNESGNADSTRTKERWWRHRSIIYTHDRM